MMQRKPGIAGVDEPPPAAPYQAYAPMIFGYLRRHAPSREDAEDLLLEVFMAAFERGNLWALPEESVLPGCGRSRAISSPITIGA